MLVRLHGLEVLNGGGGLLLELEVQQQQEPVDWALRPDLTEPLDAVAESEV
jgi:hypothetical protein